MNLLHLTGYGVKIKVNDLKNSSELEVTDGIDSYRNQPLKPSDHARYPTTT